MESINLVNSLSGLLILTSLLVIEVKRARWSAIVYGLQSLVLVMIFLALAYTMKAVELYWWAASALITKVVLVPWVLYRAMSRVSEAEMPRKALGLAASLLMAAFAVAVSFLVVNQITLRKPPHSNLPWLFRWLISFLGSCAS